jgi:hypothetical protein
MRKITGSLVAVVAMLAFVSPVDATDPVTPSVDDRSVVFLNAGNDDARLNPSNAQFKDPGTAMIFSIVIPGAGQMWAGETGRGAAILGASVGAPIVGAMVMGASCANTYNCSAAPYLVGMLVGLGAYGFGIVDASASAERMNAANAATAVRLQASPVVAQRDNGQMGFGAQLSLTF